jgi:pyridoxal phosphate enzyme (YggS family)
MDAIAQNWAEVQERVARAAAAAGRDATEIEVVAVTKTRPAEAVEAALAAGVREVGENRVQEADGKKPQVSGPARWHLIGHLQRNKAGRAVELFDLIQSIDSTRLADAVGRRAAAVGRPVEVLLQVNTAGAAQQGGVEPAAALSLARHVAGLEHLRLRGLMTIAALTDDTGAVRRCFRQLRELRGAIDSAHLDGVDMRWLSMCMSSDYELAIEEGANMLRIGSAIFGPRAA